MDSGEKTVEGVRLLLQIDKQNVPVVQKHSYAWMVELVDTRDLKSRGPCARAGSTPALGTSKIRGSRQCAGIPFVFVDRFFLGVIFP
jgi:hypothetical protein